MTPKPVLSILVATCDRKRMAIDCIESLLLQRTALPYEIIILDQSKRQKIQFAKDNVIIVDCNFTSKSRALNLGVRLAESQFIGVTDDDCRVSKDWVEFLYKRLRANQESIITGKVYQGEIEAGGTLSRVYDLTDTAVVYKKGIITPIYILAGCNFGFTKEIYRKLIGFDENFGPGAMFKSSEDNEFSYRALRAGMTIMYFPEVVIYHRSWRNNAQDRELMRVYGFGAGAFFGLLYSYNLLDLIYHSTKLLSWIIKNGCRLTNFPESINHWLYVGQFFKGLYTYFNTYGYRRKAT